jgi:hypothetical protein
MAILAAEYDNNNTARQLRIGPADGLGGAHPTPRPFLVPHKAGTKYLKALAPPREQIDHTTKSVVFAG